VPRYPLFSDNAGNAKETALPLRRLLQHDLAIEAWADDILALNIARLNDLRRCGNMGDVEFSKGVYVFQQIAKLRAKTLDLIFGERNSRKFGYISNVNLLG
jgi:hypothetical protein